MFFQRSARPRVVTNGRAPAGVRIRARAHTGCGGRAHGTTASPRNCRANPKRMAVLVVAISEIDFALFVADRVRARWVVFRRLPFVHPTAVDVGLCAKKFL